MRRTSFFSGLEFQRRAILIRALPILAAGTAACIATETAVAQTWTTNTSGSIAWSAATWTGGVPTGGTSSTVQFFPDQASGIGAGQTLTAGNDLAGLVVNKLVLRGTSTSAGTEAKYVISGNAITFDGTAAAIDANPGYGTGSGTSYNITAPLTFNAATAISLGGSGGQFSTNSALSGSAPITFSSVLSNRAINMNGGSTASTYTGDVTAAVGVLQLGKSNNIFGSNSATTQALTVNSGAQALLAYGNAAYTQNQNFILNGAGNGTSTFAALRITGINFGNGSIRGLALPADATMNVAGQSAANGTIVNVNGPLVGSGNLTLTGTEPIAFNATSTAVTWAGTAFGVFSGNVNVNSGAILLGTRHSTFGGNSSGLGGQTVTIAPGAAVVFNDGSGAYSADQNFVLSGSGYTNSAVAYPTMQLNNVAYGNHTIGGLAIVGGATVSVNQASGAGDGQQAVRGLQLKGPIVGTGTLTKTGVGPLYINQASTSATWGSASYSAFSGDVNINAGAVVIGKANNILGPNSGGTQTVTVANGAAVSFANGNAAYAAPQRFVLNGPGTATTPTLLVNDINFGNQTIGSVVIATNATISAVQNATPDNASRGLIITGGLAGSGALTKTGTAPLYLNAAAAASGTFGAFNGNVNVNGGRIVLGNADAIGTAAQLSIAAGANVTANAGLPKALVVTALTATGTLQLNNNSLVVDYTGASPIASIRSALAAGYAGGNWAGSSGIVSATAGASSGYGIAYAEASVIGVTTFGSRTVDADAIVAQYSRLGDSNLSGSIDTVDFNNLIAGFGSPGTVWTQGDFNYDGVTDGTDFTLLVTNFGLTSPAPLPASAPGALVPEPTALLGALAASGILLARRPRKG